MLICYTRNTNFLIDLNLPRFVAALLGDHHQTTVVRHGTGCDHVDPPEKEHNIGASGPVVV